MPTVPVFIVDSLVESGAPVVPNDGVWHVASATAVLANNVCLNYTGSGIGWGMSLRTASYPTASVSFSPPADITKTWSVGHYTYPDGAQVSAVSAYQDGGFWRHTRAYNPLFGGGGASVTSTAFSLVFDGDSVTMNLLDLLSWGKSTLNGVTVYDGLIKGQLRYSGSGVIDFPLNKTGVENFFNGTVNTSESLVIERWHRKGTVGFPLSAKNIEIRFGNSYGEWTDWQRLKFFPAGTFTATATEDEAFLDASGIFVLGGDIKSGDGFYYYTGVPPFKTDQPVATRDISSLGKSDGDTLNISLQAISQAGCIKLFTASPVVEGGDKVSAMADGDGVGYVAVVENGNILVKEALDGTEVTKFTLLNHDSPSLYQIQGWTRFHLTARDRATGNVRQYLSDDHCANFVEVF